MPLPTDMPAVPEPPIDSAPQAPEFGLPWTPQDTERWRARIAASDAIMRDLLVQAKKNIAAYLNRNLMSAPVDDLVSVPATTWYLDNKRSQLFFRVPEVVLTPKKPTAEPNTHLAQAVVNEYLGPERAHIKTVMDEVIFDLLCPMGFGVLKVGYEAYPQTVADPTGQTTTIVAENYYARRIPPGRLIRPVDFMGSDYDDADYIGFHFEENVPPGTPGAVTSSDRGERDDFLLTVPTAGEGARGARTVRRGVEVWYKRRLEDPSVSDPFAYAMFILMDGESEPRRHDVSPYHVLAATGWAGANGFPVKVLKTRYISDSADAPSDTQITRILNEELSRGRTQLVVSRDRKMPTVIYNSATPGIDEVIDKIRRNESHGFIGVPANPASIFLVLDKGATAQENYRFNEVATDDMDRAWALGSNQQGVPVDSARTATELQLIQNNSETRLDYERAKVADFFCHKVARNILGLVQVFADDTQYIRLLGPDGAARMVQWSKEQIQGEFGFSIKANSQLRPDNAADLKRTTDVINFASKSPYVNQKELWRAAMIQWGFDVERVIKDPEPPKSDPPNVSITLQLKPTDFADPLTQPFAVALAKAAGMELEGMPPALPIASGVAGPSATDELRNLLTPGTADTADVLSKHKFDETGRLPGSGSTVGELAQGAPQGPVQ